MQIQMSFMIYGDSTHNQVIYDIVFVKWARGDKTIDPLAEKIDTPKYAFLYFWICKNVRELNALHFSIWLSVVTFSFNIYLYAIEKMNWNWNK